jgi:hypothetical protein
MLNYICTVKLRGSDLQEKYSKTKRPFPQDTECIFLIKLYLSYHVFMGAYSEMLKDISTKSQEFLFI